MYENDIKSNERASKRMENKIKPWNIAKPPKNITLITECHSIWRYNKLMAFIVSIADKSICTKLWYNWLLNLHSIFRSEWSKRGTYTNFFLFFFFGLHTHTLPYTSNALRTIKANDKKVRTIRTKSNQFDQPNVVMAEGAANHKHSIYFCFCMRRMYFSPAEVLHARECVCNKRG